MPLTDILIATYWWSLLFLIGMLVLPFTSTLFQLFWDKGYAFSKVVGIVFLSYSMFALGTLHILPFTQMSLFFLCLCIFLLIVYQFRYKRKQKLHTLFPSPAIIIFEEIIFLLAFFALAFVRAHQPDIHGLEKYMDFGFVNSILRSTYFPPKDMWFTPFSINYYYFGHLLTAVLTKLSGIPSSITFNLMLATLFGFTCVLSFSIACNLLSFITKPKTKKQHIHIIIGGLLSGLLVGISGNLHVLYTFFKPYENESPIPFTQLAFSFNTFPNSYWYPNATRFIYHTIHEFPLYSFVVSDLHGHVIGIPLVLTMIAFLLHLLIKKNTTLIDLVFLGLLLACAYMTNAWDGGIYLILSVSILFFIHLTTLKKPHKTSTNISTLFNRNNLLKLFTPIALIVIAFILFSLPFALFFQTGAIVHGIGILCAPEFLTKLQNIGPFLFETDHCQRSPLWQLLILYGFFYFWVVSFLVFITLEKKDTESDQFVLLLIFVATLLIILPEFVYVKDIYPAHYRANTMFKLVYQSFIMLSLSSGYIIVRLFSQWRKIVLSLKRITPLFPPLFLFWMLLGCFGICLVFIYPVFAVGSYYDNLKTYHSLDGTSYLGTSYPDDYEAILWLNAHSTGQPVILEAQGDSYTDYARVSSNTGLPTVLGWTVHEWLWRGTYDVPAPRITEITTAYQTHTVSVLKAFIKKYKIEYIFVGNLEREKYPKLSEATLLKVGTVIFHKGQTKIIQVANAD